ncbi:MAG: extracellular solute-binding protein [Kiritimatiellia bacterium]
MIKTVFSLLLCLGALTLSAERFPAPGWVEGPDPNASPFAQPGGTLVYAGSNPPKSFNGYLDNNTFTAMIFNLLYPTLLSIDPTTSEFSPALADWWEISEDKMFYTFHIDPRARWSDGSPITGEDVKATFDAVMAPSSLSGQYKVSFSALESPRIIDRLTVTFPCKEIHWRNLSSIGLSLSVMPKKLLDSRPFNDLNFTLPIVGGPYEVSEHKEGISMTLKRRPDYWGFSTPAGKGIYNFDRIRIRFFMDQNNAYEAFKKGEVDTFAVYSARVWNTESIGERFEKNWIVKQNIHNHNPIGFQGLCFNMRREPYDDLRVRKALAMLFDRRRMVRTLMYNAYFMQRSFFEDLYDSTYPCNNTLIEYDPEKAFQLLLDAGFVLNTSTGFLEKNGTPFVVNILTRSASDSVYLALYKEALSRVGIQLTITQKDFATWMREMEKYNFDVTTSAFSGSLFRDPEPLWSSSYANVPSSVNLPGFKNTEVDQLINKQRTEFSATKRNGILRRIDAITTATVPYILTWGTDSVRLLYWNKFGTPDCILGKFGNEMTLPIYWWYDADSARELGQAMKDGTPVSGRTAEIYYDNVMQNPDHIHTKGCSHE